MSNISKSQLGILKKIVAREEGKSATGASTKEKVKNTNDYEAFGRAIIEQIQRGSMKEAEKADSSTDEIVVDTQITISPATSSSEEEEEEEEEWVSAAIIAGSMVATTVGDFLTGKGVCVTVFGQKICWKP